VRDTKGLGLLEFDNGGGVFHIPYRCEKMTRNGDLCEACETKEKKTMEKVAKISGSTIQGMLPSYLNGRITEPIPFWSRLYDGAWYRLKISSGSTVSEDTMARVRKAAAVAYEGVEMVEPQAMPGTRKPRAKKVVAAAAVAPVAAAPAPVAAAVVPVVAAAPVPVVPVPTPAAPVAPVKKAQRKGPKAKEPVNAVAAVATLDPVELPVEETHEVYVRVVEVDERKLYLAPKKQKLYDLKFKYIGRLKDGKIVAFPDSDADMY
jgi:hypothetical protein